MRCAIVLVVLGTATLAYAEPTDIVDRPLVLDGNEVEAALTLEANIGPNAELGHPISLAPDLWWGVAPRWTIGVIHSSGSVDQFAAGASFCLRTAAQNEHGCTRAYRGSGVDVRYAALPWLAPRVRVLLRDVDPWKPALTLGALAKWTRGRLAITGDPYLQLGLANTDSGNRAWLFLPVTIAVQPTCRWAIEGRTGWNSELANWSDGWHVPAYVGFRARATSQLDVTGGLGFVSLLGPQNTAKERAVFFTVDWRGGGAALAR